MVKIVVDSTADIPADLCDQYDISVVPLNVRFGEESFRDGVDITKDQFYARLVASNTMPATSTPTPGAFIEVYERLASQSDAILSIHISGKLSSTVETARQAAAMLPQTRIEVIDSRSTAMVIGFMAIAASQAARMGQGLAELVAMVQDIRARAFLHVGLDTLHYLEKGGRIGKARSLLGTLLNVKPLIEVGDDGEVRPLEQVRTTKRMMTRLVELAQAQHPLSDLAVLYTGQRQIAETVALQLEERNFFPQDQIRIVQLGSVIGAHVGPGSVALAGVRAHG